MGPGCVDSHLENKHNHQLSLKRLIMTLSFGTYPIFISSETQ